MLKIRWGLARRTLEPAAQWSARLAARAAKPLAIAHEYAEFPGGHTWEYWDRHVQEAIEFHARVLGLERRPRD